MQIQKKISVYNDLYNDRISEKFERLDKLFRKRKPKKRQAARWIVLLSLVAVIAFSFSLFYVNRYFDENIFSTTPEFSSFVPEYSSSNAVFGTYSPEVSLYITDRGNETYSLDSKSVTLSALFEDKGIVLDESCTVNYPLYTTVFEGMEVVIDSFTYEDYSEDTVIPFEQNVTNLQTIPRGTKQIVTQGSNGTLRTTYRKYYKNGELIETKTLSEVTVKAPVSEVSYLGVGGTIVGNDGKTYSYSYYLDVTATAYGAAEGFTGRTSTGVQVREGIIAVDPRVISYHTKCYVTGSGYDWGVCYAEDTGSAIVGNRIDVYMDGPLSRLLQFGRRSMRVYILD